mgnify:CR=1 FL=1
MSITIICIISVDCNSFYASSERVLRPDILNMINSLLKSTMIVRRMLL